MESCALCAIWITSHGLLSGYEEMRLRLVTKTKYTNINLPYASNGGDLRNGSVNWSYLPEVP